MSGWAQWEPWAVGGVIAVLVAGFIARALFSDRARGRPRCHRCGYDFEGVEGLTCPECGWTARTPADLLRTRRHWFKAIVGVTLLILAAAMIRLQAAGGNPLLIVPDRIMIALLPIDPTAGGTEIGPIADELRRRLVAEELDVAEVEMLFARIATGDDGARPVLSLPGAPTGCCPTTTRTASDRSRAQRQDLHEDPSGRPDPCRTR